MKQCWAAVVVVLILTAASSAVAAGDVWQGGALVPGQMYHYRLFSEVDGDKGSGQAQIWLQDDDSGWVLLILQGEFAGAGFELAAQGDPDDIDDLFVQAAMGMMFELPDEILDIFFRTLWLPWYEMGFSQVALEIGWERLEIDDWGDEIYMAIVDHCSQGNFDGCLVVVEMEEVGETMRLEICIDPLIPLPLSVWATGSGATVYGAELTAFAADAAFAGEIPEISEWLFRPARPRGVLADLLDFFAENGLYVDWFFSGFPQAYGASAGFSLEMAGGDLEVYWFDPDRISPKLQEKLDEAAQTGRFFVEEWDLEAAVVVRGQVMLVGLEEEPYYTHPNKDRIISAFMLFQP